MSCARETTLVSSRVLSTVERVFVRAGGRVEADDLLVSLDQRDLKARLESLTASRAAIDARLQEAQKTLVRTEELLERDLLSEADADKAVAAEAALLAERQAVNETAKGARSCGELYRGTNTIGRRTLASDTRRVRAASWTAELSMDRVTLWSC